MRAVVVAGPGRVVLEDVAEPEIQAPTDVVLDVVAAGVCGTDTHAVAHAPESMPEGTVLGHEFVGRVRELGSAVTRLALGDLVVGSDFTACGACPACRRRDHWHCPERQFFGTGTAYGPALPGALAERVRVPHAEVTLGHLPVDIPAEEAVLATDTLATALTAVDRGGVGPGDVVAVLGAGPVGQLTGMVARSAGASAVIVSEPSGSRRVEAEAHGLVAVEPGDLMSAGLELTGGRGFDVAIEAVGLTSTLTAATSVVRGQGTVVMVGVPAEALPALPLREMFRREVDLRFAIGDPIRQRDRLLSILRTHQIAARSVLGNVVSLEQTPSEFGRFASGERPKIVATP